MRPAIYSLEELDFIMKNAEDMTAHQIAAKFGLSLATVYNIGSKHGLTFKKPGKGAKVQCAGVRGPYVRRDPAFSPEPKKAPIQRPPACYSNTGNINLLNQYA
jgi:hypothetical protein